MSIPDPWICREGCVELRRDGHLERLPVDPTGTVLTEADHDAYRIEFEAATAAIAGTGKPRFGRADAVAQATVLDALRRAATDVQPVS